MERVRGAENAGVVDHDREACVHLGPDVSSLGEGRRFVAKTLREWDVDEETIEPVMLVANELVANAIVHAHSAPVLSLEGTGTDLMLRVADEAPDLKVERRETPGEDGGRGLVLVEALCDGWGVDASESGKCIWASFADALS
jgi:anti-sigma regulatory factor (Ser/Thr protein kinase)